MDNSIPCPMYKDGVRCTGKLEKLGNIQTCMGTMNGLDNNKTTEQFKCTTCGAIVERSWSWKPSTDG